MTTPATIYEVAARAGVSISTVSLAINHPARVSAKTRAEVVLVADGWSWGVPAGFPARDRPGITPLCSS